MVAGGSDSAAAAISLSISSSNLNRGSLGIGTSGHPYTYAHPIRSRSGAFVLSCRWWILFAGSDVSGRWLCVGIEIHLRRIILTPS